MERFDVSERKVFRAVRSACSAQRYFPKIRDVEDRLIESMVDLATKYGRYEYIRIAALLQREELESDATNWYSSVNSFMKIT
jgi:hypothetical protein